MDDFIGMEVIDDEGKSIGKIDGVEFDEEEALITKVIVKLDKGIFSREKEKINYDKISKIKDVVLLKDSIDID
ncbi:PRC-barrel domain-containing protein [Methanobrevibacter sp. DSM 116169]|uniref:PRC-barrel domain-containing protein n=1 Tax=Methanobrevibacter sp. DSM 116169 TaxID=3242727 RepID=UPI0038FBE85C